MLRIEEVSVYEEVSACYNNSVRYNNIITGSKPNILMLKSKTGWARESKTQKTIGIVRNAIKCEQVVPLLFYHNQDQNKEHEQKQDQEKNQDQDQDY